MLALSMVLGKDVGLKLAPSSSISNHIKIINFKSLRTLCYVS